MNLNSGAVEHSSMIKFSSQYRIRSKKVHTQKQDRPSLLIKYHQHLLMDAIYQHVDHGGPNALSITIPIIWGVMARPQSPYIHDASWLLRMQQFLKLEAILRAVQ